MALYDRYDQQTTFYHVDQSGVKTEKRAGDLEAAEIEFDSPDDTRPQLVSRA